MAGPRVAMIWRAGWTLVIATSLVLLCGSCASEIRVRNAKYCAIMPDSVGLYVNNPVTKMGYRIGRITGITPDMQSVRVDFTVNEALRLPNDVRAVTRSTSILADRSLELVGTYESGPVLPNGGCIPLGRSSTPKSLSQVIGASTDFINSIEPAGSTTIGDVVTSVDQSLRSQGSAVNELMSKTAVVLDSPDQAIGNIGSIVANLSSLTSTLTELEPALRGVMEDSQQIAPDIVDAVWGAGKIFEGQMVVIPMVADLERELGGEFQQTLDAVSAAVRKLTPRAPFYARFLDPAPRYITGLANIVNDHQFSIRYRPPLYRVRTPDGVLQCNIMNASMPGSCANVNGTPYAVDVALLQYVLTEASR